MKIDFPHAMYEQTLPKFEGIASYGPCPPPGHPQTTQIQFNILKNSFCEKLDFHVFFCSFSPIRLCLKGFLLCSKVMGGSVREAATPGSLKEPAPRVPWAS